MCVTHGRLERMPKVPPLRDINLQTTRSLRPAFNPHLECGRRAGPHRGELLQADKSRHFHCRPSSFVVFGLKKWTSRQENVRTPTRYGHDLHKSQETKPCSENWIKFFKKRIKRGPWSNINSSQYLPEGQLHFNVFLSKKWSLLVARGPKPSTSAPEERAQPLDPSKPAAGRAYGHLHGPRKPRRALYFCVKWWLPLNMSKRQAKSSGGGGVRERRSLPLSLDFPPCHPYPLLSPQCRRMFVSRVRGAFYWWLDPPHLP